MFHIKLLLCGLMIKLQLAIIPIGLTDRSPINTSAAGTTISITAFHSTVCLNSAAVCMQNMLTVSKCRKSAGTGKLLTQKCFAVFVL